MHSKFVLAAIASVAVAEWHTDFLPPMHANAPPGSGHPMALTEDHTAYPGDSCCQLYNEVCYGGEFIRLCLVDNVPKVWNILDFGWGNTVESYNCGKHVRYAFCDTEKNCGYGTGSSGAGNTRNPKMGHQHDTDWVQMWPLNITLHSAVNIYDDYGCMGQSAAFFSTDENGVARQYNEQEIQQANYYDNRGSSIKVPFGFSATLYDKDAYQGNSITIVGDYWEDANQAMKCINLDGTDESASGAFNNKMTSLEVTKEGVNGVTAMGYWISATSTEMATFSVKYGYSYSQTEEHKETQTEYLQKEQDVGMAFKHGSSSYKVTKTYTHQITNDVTTTTTEDAGATVTLTCTPRSGESGVGLWQWVSETADGKTRMWSNHTVCRYGSEWATSPGCPWNACLDGSCSTCTDDWEEK